MAKFIVIAGKKQAGKSTAAKYIAGRLDLAKVVSFADPIKEFCANILGLTSEQIYGTDEEKSSYTSIKWKNMPQEIKDRYAYECIFPKNEMTGQRMPGTYTRERIGPMTAREVMQVFGTDIVRNFFGYNTWAFVPFRKWHATLQRYIVIDDCRFPNEADLALHNKAILIYLTRDVCAGDVHSSETALDNYPRNRYTHVIDNQDLTIEETQAILKEIVDATEN